MLLFRLVVTPLLLLGLFTGGFVVHETHDLTTQRYEWKSERVPAEADGLRIVHLSDLHSTSFGPKQWLLLRTVHGMEPDLVVLTGDFIDENGQHDLGPTQDLLQGLGDVPVFFVDGNHDPRAETYGALLELLESYGVTVLNGTTAQWGGMTIGGVTYGAEAEAPACDILLCHDPSAFPQMAQPGVGLVLSGHMHGGQVALPGGIALVSPDGQYFPKYAGGYYTEGESTLVVSRGLGNSGVPFRLFARPEVVCIELRAQK